MQIVFNFLAGLVVVISIFLSAKTSILKDTVIIDPKQAPVKTYSFARSQGMWWTTIIAFCFILGSGTASNHLIELNKTCLVLLSIGVSTTVLGKVIDNSDLEAKIERYQDNPEIKSEGFFKDILRDGTGITVYRFQALIFNVVFGLIFLSFFFESGMTKFAEFENPTLGLMGISASTYLAMKTTENTKTQTPIKKPE